MKRKVLVGAVTTALIFICIALNAKIIDPTDFTGVWYRADNGVPYKFQDGIIECTNKEIILLDDSAFSGAYIFAKDKVAIFVVDDHGVGEVVELHLIHRPDGDILCERKDGTDIAWFCRNRDTSIK